MSRNPAQLPIKNPGLLFIGNQWVSPSSDAMIEIVSPATEEVFMRVAEAQEADINRAVAAARDAFDNGPWPRMSPVERAKYLRLIEIEMAKRADDIALVWPNEMGVTHAFAQAGARGLPSFYGFYADMAETFDWETAHRPLEGGSIGLLVREPVGVVAAIIPWNGPIFTITHKVAPALLAGCTIVLKASPEAPGAAYIMAEVFEAVGLPKGVVNVVAADRAVSETLVRHPGIDMVSFTGSSAAGKRIASILGERIGRYALELGGKSAAVILDDYDLESAAQSIAGTTCALSGQICSALTRVIVSRDRHDAMVEALAANFSMVNVGDPFDPAVGMGPVAMRRQRDRIESLIQKGREEGATLATGGGRPKHLNRGYFIEPTVFGNVDNNMTIAREEIFGPVVSVIPANDEEHAIRLANDTVYGLNNSVFTNDPDRAYAVGRRLHSGTVGHNVWRTDFSIAFGGFKESGVGREGGVEGVYPYTEAKTLIFENGPSHISA